MRELVVLLFCLVAAATAAGDLVRCKRPLCDMACPYGLKKDSRGCEICDCAIDPCKTFKCKEGEMCTVPSCASPMCETPKPKCTGYKIKGIVPCAVPMCANKCDYGYKKDKNGCETCNCKANSCDGHVCPSGEKCRPAWEQCPQDVGCWPKPMCEAKNKCSDPMCRMICVNGFQKDDNGCDTCKCKKDVCDTEKCPDDQVCMPKPMMFMCRGAPCAKPSCTAKPLCHRQREMHKSHVTAMGSLTPHMMPIHEHMMHKPQCMTDGSFKPLQCHDMAGACWCVDDRGMEITGSRKDVTNMKHEKPTCYPKKKKVPTATLR